MASDDAGTGTDAGADSPRIVDVEDARRYELWAGYDRVGFAAYRREPGRITFTHTVVDPAHEGHGYGSAIARAVVADAVKRGDTIDSLARQMAYDTLQRDRFMTLNAIEDEAQLTPGHLVKIVTRG